MFVGERVAVRLDELVDDACLRPNLFVSKLRLDVPEPLEVTI